VGRRVAWAIVVAGFLMFAVVALLYLADAYGLAEHSRRCTTNFWASQWPKWFGCAMAAHEDLTAGLVGGAGALFAAWLAFHAVQEQFSRERDRRDYLAKKAKEAAKYSAEPLIRTAAAVLRAIVKALAATDQTQIKEADELAEIVMAQLRADLGSFLVRDTARELEGRDRTQYLSIIGKLNTIASVRQTFPDSKFRGTREKRLTREGNVLIEVHRLLVDFDTYLANLFSTVSEIAQPARLPASAPNGTESRNPDS
jgi:hypothetical protein